MDFLASDAAREKECKLCGVSQELCKHGKGLDRCMNSPTRRSKRGLTRSEQIAQEQQAEQQTEHVPGKQKMRLPKAAPSSAHASAAKRWASVVEPALTKASAEEARALTKSLFHLAWAHAGESAATAAVGPLCERVKQQERAAAAAAEAAAARPQFDGQWRLYDSESQLAGQFDADDNTLLLENADEECCMEEKDPKPADVFDYKYKGEVMSWGNCQDDFKVTLLVSHDPDGDTIDGEVSVTPRGSVSYGPPDAFGGGFCFTGKRDDDF